MIHKTICSCLVKRCTGENIAVSRPVHNRRMGAGGGPNSAVKSFTLYSRAKPEGRLTAEIRLDMRFWHCV